MLGLARAGLGLACTAQPQQNNRVSIQRIDNGSEKWPGVSVPRGIEPLGVAAF
jgi:hypothetical protein